MYSSSVKVKDRYRIILDSVGKIPKGKVVTYGDIARLSGLINCARIVGYALRSLPENSKIPWYRVVNSQGKISFPINSSNHQMQRMLLEDEGIIFRNNKINLEKYGWLKYVKGKRRR
ncbi:MAG: MGMT family protein [Ignavibacteriales bacterium]|nr:MGMT family protein [Ignavibacteriales bacterium]